MSCFVSFVQIIKRRYEYYIWQSCQTDVIHLDHTFSLLWSNPTSVHVGLLRKSWLLCIFTASDIKGHVPLTKNDTVVLPPPHWQLLALDMKFHLELLIGTHSHRPMPKISALCITGRQCLRSGERDWLRAVPCQRALLRIGQRKWECRSSHVHVCIICYRSHVPSAYRWLKSVCIQLSASLSVFLMYFPLHAVWEHLLL